MTLMAIRPCGCAIGLVDPLSSEAAPAQARWAAQGWHAVLWPVAAAIARVLADFARHESGACQAAPAPAPVQLALFGEAA